MNELLGIPEPDEEWDRWFAMNHPWDWWAKERSEGPLPTFDRLLVAHFARNAWDAAKGR